MDRSPERHADEKAHRSQSIIMQEKKKNKKMMMMMMITKMMQEKKVSFDVKRAVTQQNHG